MGDKLGRGAIGSRKWLAAALDFEGTLGLYKSKDVKVKRGYTWRVIFTVSGTNPKLIQEVKDVCGCGFLNKAKRNGTNPNWKPIYVYRMEAGGVRKILPQIYPYLIAKRKQAVLIKEALFILSKLRKGGRTTPKKQRQLDRLGEIALDIKGLNQRGCTFA